MVPAPNVIITWVFTVAGMVCALILAWHLAGSIQLLVAYAIIFVVASWGIVYLLLRFIILRIYMWMEDKYYARKKPSN